MLFIIPKTGCRVRDPFNGYALIPSEGKEVAENSYWRRRIKDGDVTVRVEKKTAPVVKAEPVKESKKGE